MNHGSMWIGGLLVILGLSQPTIFAQSDEGSQGFLLNERIQGSASTLGAITKFDTSAGYQFNRYLAVEAGLPVYSVNPSSSVAQPTATQAATGIGNAYADLRLTLVNPLVNYTSLATVAAPTGDKAEGFSTGHVTYDWSNLFDRSFGRITPFVNLGIANTITDTPFFIRPFISYGFVTHVEGGATYKLVRRISVGASAYGIEPAGQQTVISRLTRGQGQNPGTGNGNGGGPNHGVFETAGTTVGTASIARDDGFSAWLSVRPSRYATFLVGYSRSVEYALDSVFFGLNFNLSPLIRRLL
jgi:hypothetical protein